MADSKIEFGMHGIIPAAKCYFAAARRVALVLVVGLSLWGNASVRAEDAEVAETPRPNRTNYASFQTALREQMHASAELPRESQEEPGVSNWNYLLISAEIAILMVLSFRLLVPRIGKLLENQLNAKTLTAAQSKFVEEKAVAEFATELQIAPNALTSAVEQRKVMADEFFKAAPKELKALRNLFAEISRSAEPAAHQKILRDLYTEVTAFKNKVGNVELTAAWQLASSVERLVGQLSEKPAHISHSNLRTAAGGLLLLNDLCVPDVRKDLATNPPIRFLAVDDDPISRRAVSMSLKKVAQAPDLAENGEAALELAGRQAYDAVFLDVEMPGLDGFEVCTKIHQLETNRVTPVVFVTGHSDFESRAKSISSGGRDLIAKPFLSSEITLKALTLLLRGRLDREKASREQTAKAPSVEAKAPPAVPKEKTKVPGPAAETAVAVESKNEAGKSSSEASGTAQKNANLDSVENKAQESLPADAKETAAASAVHGTENLRVMQEQVLALNLADSAAVRQEILGKLYVGLNIARSEAARAGVRPICELASALGKLISKLLEKPALSTPSALQAVSGAIGLLEELAAGGVESDVANPPIRVLVVDDEPLSRRAISNALQLTFGKPDSAENGEAGVALAQSKIYDVIFLDILMPEMDGFETCTKIRATKFNDATPIIFVTGHKDAESREKSFDCGGSGFISKPVLPTEIFLTALTFTLRQRMKNGAAALPSEKLELEIC